MKKKLEDFCKKNLILLFIASVMILCVLCFRLISSGQGAGAKTVATANAAKSASPASASDDAATDESDASDDEAEIESDETDEVADDDLNSDEVEKSDESKNADVKSDKTEDRDTIKYDKTGEDSKSDKAKDTDEGESDVDADADESESDVVTKDKSDKAEKADKVVEPAQAEKVPDPNYKEDQFVIYVNRVKNLVTVCRTTPMGEELRVKTFTCSVGRAGHATPLGTFKTSQYYDWRLMVDNTYGRYAIRFNGHIMFHSVPYFKATPDTLEWEEFNKLGSPASLGCVRMQVSDVKWIYDNCKAGTKVVVYDDPNEDDSNRTVPAKIDENSPNRDWDPSDPDINSPWNIIAEDNM